MMPQTPTGSRKVIGTPGAAPGMVWPPNLLIAAGVVLEAVGGQRTPPHRASRGSGLPTLRLQSRQLVGVLANEASDAGSKTARGRAESGAASLSGSNPPRAAPPGRRPARPPAPHARAVAVRGIDEKALFSAGPGAPLPAYEEFFFRRQRERRPACGHGRRITSPAGAGGIGGLPAADVSVGRDRRSHLAKRAANRGEGRGFKADGRDSVGAKGRTRTLQQAGESRGGR